MSNQSNTELVAPRLSILRNVLFVGLAFVWFSEMLFLGIPSLAKVHSHMWQVPVPENPQLETTLYIAWALSAPAKGALFAMAIIGLMSKNISTRIILFACSSLVPPLNMAFPFRQQGFLLRPMTIAIILSTILWVSFFLIKERSVQSQQKKTVSSKLSPPSSWEVIQYIWFSVSSAVITLIALLFLFETRTTLNIVFPCLTDLFKANEGGLSSPIHSTMAAGTHFLALAVASWIATVKCRTNPSLRQAMTIASTVLAGLIFFFPVKLLITSFEKNCAIFSKLAPFVLLFAGWVIYAVTSYRVELKNKKEHNVLRYE